MILRRQSLIRPGVAVSLAVALALTCAAPIFAHDIPSSVTVLAFVKPEGQRLRLVMRVPLESMRDVNFPLVGPGYLDLARAEPLLAEAAKLWLANEIELYEDDARLATPQIVATRISLPSDRSFSTYSGAVAHTTGEPLVRDTQLMWKQAMLDVVLVYPITSDRSRFSIQPALARAIPAWSVSIRDGIKPRCASSSSASRTSSTASTISCSSSASSSRSGRFGHSSPS